MGRNTKLNTEKAHNKILLKSVIDLHSAFFAIQICDWLIEPVTDYGASVHSLSLVIFDKLWNRNGVNVQKCIGNIQSANSTHIGVKKIVRVLFAVGGKHHEHEFQFFKEFWD